MGGMVYQRLRPAGHPGVKEPHEGVEDIVVGGRREGGKGDRGKAPSHAMSRFARHSAWAARRRRALERDQAAGCRVVGGDRPLPRAERAPRDRRPGSPWAGNAAAGPPSLRAPAVGGKSPSQSSTLCFGAARAMNRQGMGGARRARQGGGRLAYERGGGMQDRPAAADGLAEYGTLGERMHKADAVAVDRAEQHHQPREFENGLPLGLAPDPKSRLAESSKTRRSVISLSSTNFFL